MNGLRDIGIALCYTCAAVSIVSLFVPQKRTRRVMGFVIGLFFLSTMAATIASYVDDLNLSAPMIEDVSAPMYSDAEYEKEIAQMTADNVVEALHTLLENEKIKVQDIQVTLKISDEGRITVARAVIYINEAYRDRVAAIENIVYRNIAKEPEVYVNGEKPQ